MIINAIIFFIAALVVVSTILSAHYLAQIRDIVREIYMSQESPASRQGFGRH